MTQRRSQRSAALDAQIPHLPPATRRVLALLCTGQSVKEIATSLGDIKPTMVSAHIKRAYAATGCSNHVQLAVWLIAMGICRVEALPYGRLKILQPEAT